MFWAYFINRSIELIGVELTRNGQGVKVLSRLNYNTFEKIMCEYYEPKIERYYMFDVLLESAFIPEKERYSDISVDHSTMAKIRKGERRFPADVIKPYQRPKVRETVIPYFNENITKYLPLERRADLIRDLKAVISSDKYIAEDQRDNFIKLAKLETLTEFLVEAFIYAIKQNTFSPKDLMFPFNNLPYTKNEYFTDREDKIQQLHDAFRKGHGVQVLTGIGRNRKNTNCTRVFLPILYGIRCYLVG